jgi:nodulation protein E
MPLHRVVITGLGVICAVGRDVEEFWTALVAGRSGIGPLRSVPHAGLRFAHAAEVSGYNPHDHFPPKKADLLDRFAQFALVAARQAVSGSRIDLSNGSRCRAAVILGSCVGGQSTEDQGFIDLYVENRNRVHPLTVPRVMANAGASHVTMEFGLTGPAYTVATACSSSTHAIGQAFWMVRQGTVDYALAGGSEAPLSFGHLKAWEAMRVVAPDTCRPFSRDRRGLILAEGGAMLLLESLQSATARGATVLGEIVGFGMTADADHLTLPSSAGAARAMQAAIDDAGIAPERVGYINAHGTGTIANDSMETVAIRKTFAAHADRLAISSTKSMHGHALGATGAIEAVATVLTLKHGMIPPTINYCEPDPECDLDVVPHQARSAQLEYALSSSFAFGGLNAVLAFRRWDPEQESRLNTGP